MTCKRFLAYHITINLTDSCIIISKAHVDSINKCDGFNPHFLFNFSILVLLYRIFMYIELNGLDYSLNHMHGIISQV